MINENHYTKAKATRPPMYLRAFELYGSPPDIIKEWKNKVLGQAGLTIREREVIELVLHGLPTLEIGNQLGMREKTVKHHLHKIFQKFDVSSRPQLFAEIFDL